jgi:hypothetical protein
MIVCRARTSSECYHGRKETTIYPDGTQTDDGTWDGESVVCDACIIDVEAFANDNDRPMLYDAIEHYRANLAHVRKVDDLSPLMSEAQTRAAEARPGSPLARSAAACLMMVQQEAVRREGP